MSVGMTAHYVARIGKRPNSKNQVTQAISALATQKNADHWANGAQQPAPACHLPAHTYQAACSCKAENTSPAPCEGL
jgi:hypothetical protein